MEMHARYWLSQNFSPWRGPIDKLENGMAIPATHRFGFYAILLLLFIAAVLTRSHSLDRSLWLDEAWVANSILEPTIHEMLYYRSWLQTSPPLFLILVRWVVAMLGISNDVFRLIPVVFGVLSVVLMIYVARRFLRPFFSLVATLLFVLCPAVVYYSHELKQYTTDVFASLVLIGTGLMYLQRPSRTNFYSWLSSLLILPFLSYPALLFIPGMCFAMLFNLAGGHRSASQITLVRAKWFDVLVVSILGLIVSGSSYFFFIVPNIQPQLESWFDLDSLRHASSLSLLLFELKQLPDLASLLFLQEVYWRPDLIIFKILVLLVVLIGIGTQCCVRDPKRNRRDPTTAIFLVMPIPCLYSLNALGFYPVGVARLLLFLVPIIIILFVHGLQTASYGLSALVAKGRVDALVDGLAVLSLIVVASSFLLFTSAKDLAPFFVHEPMDNSELAVRYLSEKVEPPDILYVHASMREEFKLYSRLMPVAAQKSILGNISWPCCPRDVSLNEQKDRQNRLRGELERLEIPENGSVWLLFIDLPGYWSRMERNDPEMFDRWLARAGFFHAQAIPFHGVRIDKYESDGSRVKSAQSLREIYTRIAAFRLALGPA
jgi:hypothetical protein